MITTLRATSPPRQGTKFSAGGGGDSSTFTIGSNASPHRLQKAAESPLMLLQFGQVKLLTPKIWQLGQGWVSLQGPCI